jgi:3-oxoacyl-[acyl-carrier-protein] synthase III
MEMLAVAHAVPDLVLTNDDAIAMFRERNGSRFTAKELDALEAAIRRGLLIAGTQKRHVTPPGEPAKDLVVKAAKAALAQAKRASNEVDLIIFVGIGRGWLEPAMASWVQRELKIDGATGFDLLDACASWLRGLEVAQAMLRSGRYRTALLVNSEAGMSEFANLQLPRAEALAEYFATFTLGEAATATVLVPSPNHDFYFNFSTYPDGFDLCLFPFRNVLSYAPEIASRGLQPNQFYAQSDRLVARTTRRIVETYRADSKINHGNYDVFFSHSASARAIEIIAAQLGLPMDRYIPTHAEYGNTSSASIPLGMSLAIKDGRLARGNRVLAIAGSAGITAGFASFTF